MGVSTRGERVVRCQPVGVGRVAKEAGSTEGEAIDVEGTSMSRLGARPPTRVGLRHTGAAEQDLDRHRRSTFADVDDAACSRQRWTVRGRTSREPVCYGCRDLEVAPPALLCPVPNCPCSRFPPRLVRTPNSLNLAPPRAAPFPISSPLSPSSTSYESRFSINA